MNLQKYTISHLYNIFKKNYELVVLTTRNQILVLIKICKYNSLLRTFEFKLNEGSNSLGIVYSRSKLEITAETFTGRYNRSSGQLCR